MSPAQFFTGAGISPIGTPPVANAVAVSAEDTALYARVVHVLQQGEEKRQLIQELVTRYEYMSQDYQRLNSTQAELAASWQAEKAQYEQHIRSLRLALERNPFVVVLIDGDGMIFRDEFIRDGEMGGRRAAAKLQSAIADFMRNEVDNIPTEARIICRIYANVRGLADVLVRNGTVEEIAPVEDFVRGFTRGKTLFDFVDVGPGKDRADDKLIETFKIYTNDFHCRHVFLGCSHDNGYARALEDNCTDPIYTSKVTLLEGVPFEKELVALPYKTKKFPGIFREYKVSVQPGAVSPLPGNAIPITKNFNILGGLPSRFPPPPRQGTPHDLLLDSPIQHHVLPNMPRTPSTSTLASNDGVASRMNWAAKAAAPPPLRSETPQYKPANREEVIARNRTGQRVDPPCRDYDKAEVDRIKKIKMCNVHFLRHGCAFGNTCTHLHAYNPTENELSTLRLVARMAPCQNGSGCQDDKCIYGHRCPAPPSKNPGKSSKSCIFGEQCKFPPELHDIDCNVVKTLVVR